MTRYLLDTNIISNLILPTPSQYLVRWMEQQVDMDLHISTLTLAEIERGILSMPQGRKRRDLESWFDGVEGPRMLFAGRVLAFDEHVAHQWALLMAEGRAAGRSRSALDMIIGATALANHCVVVTDNEKDFWGIDHVNPVRAAW